MTPDEIDRLQSKGPAWAWTALSAKAGIEARHVFFDWYEPLSRGEMRAWNGSLKRKALCYWVLALSWLLAVGCGIAPQSEIRAAEQGNRSSQPATNESDDKSADVQRPIPIILDTDIGTDVDDAYALVLAARSDQLRLLAVTTVYGNVEVRSAIARKLLLLMGEERIPIASGQSKAIDGHEASWGGWEGRGILTPNENLEGISKLSASDLIVDVLKDSNEKVVIVSVGGLTNIALALQKDDGIKEKIERLVIMGGCIQSIMIRGQRLPDRLETNLHNDVDAAAMILRSGLPITLVPADVTFQTRLLREDYERIQHANFPLAEAMTRMTAIWEPILKSGLKTMGVAVDDEAEVVMLHDPLAVSTLIDPTLVKMERQRIRVELEEGTIRIVADDGGSNVIDLVKSADLVRLSRLVTNAVLSERAKE